MSGPDDETLLECESCDGRGALESSETRGSGYSFTYKTCEPCRGIGVLTRTALARWRAAQAMIPKYEPAK